MRRALIAVVVFVTLVSSSPAGAQYRTPRPDTRRMGACEAAIGRRQVRLNILTKAITSDVNIHDDHKATLNAQIDAARKGLAALRDKIAGEGSDRVFLNADCERIRDDYRVYVIISPKVRQVIVADGYAAVAARIKEIVTKIQAKVDEQKARGVDVSAAQTAIDASNEAADRAIATANGVPPKIIDLTPSDWPGAREKLLDVRSIEVSLRGQLVDARQQAANAIEDMRNHAGGGLGNGG